MGGGQVRPGDVVHIVTVGTVLELREAAGADGAVVELVMPAVVASGAIVIEAVRLWLPLTALTEARR